MRDRFYVYDKKIKGGWVIVDRIGNMTFPTFEESREFAEEGCIQYNKCVRKNWRELWYRLWNI